MFGDDVRAATTAGLDGTVTIAGWSYPSYRLMLVAVAAVLALRST